SVGYIESTTNHGDVIELNSRLDSIQNAINASDFEGIRQHLFNKPSHLGELQISYQEFLESFLLLSDFLPDGLFLKKKERLQTDLQILSALNYHLSEQRLLQMEDVRLSEQTFKAHEMLNDSQ